MKLRTEKEKWKMEHLLRGNFCEILKERLFDYTGIDLKNKVIIKTRKTHILDLRTIYYYLCREFMNMSYEDIGKTIGKDRGTVRHALIHNLVFARKRWGYLIHAIKFEDLLRDVSASDKLAMVLKQNGELKEKILQQERIIKNIKDDRDTWEKEAKLLGRTQGTRGKAKVLG